MPQEFLRILCPIGHRRLGRPEFQGLRVDVDVAIDESGKQCAATAVDSISRADTDRAIGDLPDPRALHQHECCRLRFRIGAIEYPSILKQYQSHQRLLPDVRSV